MSVTVRSLRVSKEHKVIAIGQSVEITAEITDSGLSTALLDPTLVPTITIKDNVGTAVATDQNMTKISTGFYKYVHQTLPAHITGIYYADVSVTHGTASARREKAPVFNIYRTSSFSIFNYLSIKDQSGVVWHWYVAADNTLAVSATVPSITNKTAVSNTPVVVPSWLEINNPTPALRYVHPTLTGDPTAVAAQPAVGTGNVGSPTFTGVSGGNFKIAVNVSDEVILQTV